MSYQNYRIQFKNEIEKIRQPSSCCQACLSQKCEPNDYILTCAICQGSIHKNHYASELVWKTINQNHLTSNLQDWKCQRCRYFIEKRFQQQIKCQFCPHQRGIMKRVIFEQQYPTGGRKQIWVHPQCTTWCHPIIWMKNKKRAHYYKEIPKNPTLKFWFRIQNESQSKCTLCQDSYGYKIKCTFYSCHKFYHITCAKKIGVVRDLQSMRFDSLDEYSAYCPVYCEQHLQNYVLDFANRIKIYTQKKQNDKVVHFTKLHNSYKIQLKNLHNGAKRARQQQQMRNQLGKRFFMNNFQQSSMSLSISQLKSNQIPSSDSESHSSGLLNFLDNAYNLDDIDKFQPKGDNKKENKQRNQSKNIWSKKKQIFQQKIVEQEKQIVIQRIQKYQMIQEEQHEIQQGQQDQINNENPQNIQQMKDDNDQDIFNSSYENISFSLIVNSSLNVSTQNNVAHNKVLNQNQMLQEIEESKSNYEKNSQE